MVTAVGTGEMSPTGSAAPGRWRCAQYGSNEQHRQVLQERAEPAVGEQQRQRAGTSNFGVDDVQNVACYLSAPLG
jgi:hypothetical protein